MMQIVGQRYGRLLVLKEADRRGSNRVWVCQCDCGVVVEVRQAGLRSGRTGSCGCLRADTTAARNETHGMTGTTTYRTWASMITRCRNPNSTSYNRYGARGVSVCPRWVNSFEHFVEDMGKRPQGKTLERIGGAKVYSKETCTWATPTEQALSRSTTRWVTHQGVSLCLKDWAKHIGMPYLKLYKRYVYRGWSFEESIKD